MEEGRKPEYPEKTPGERASENATYYSPKIQAPSETQTRAVALVAGWESRHANRYTTRRGLIRASTVGTFLSTDSVSGSFGRSKNWPNFTLVSLLKSL